MKIFLYILLALVIVLAIVYFVGPKPTTPIYAKGLPLVPELPALPTYVAAQEAKYKIKPGNEAEIVWADSNQFVQTEYAIVYLHGFSASKEEEILLITIWQKLYMPICIWLVWQTMV